MCAATLGMCAAAAVAIYYDFIRNSFMSSFLGVCFLHIETKTKTEIDKNCLGDCMKNKDNNFLFVYCVFIGRCPEVKCEFIVVTAS